MFGFHWPELVIVLVVALLVFGPKKLPEMGSSVGKAIKEFRKGINELSAPKDEPAITPRSEVEAVQLPLSSKEASLETPAYASEGVAAEKLAE